jgi:hypothetical protein
MIRPPCWNAIPSQLCWIGQAVFDYAPAKHPSRETYPSLAISVILHFAGDDGQEAVLPQILVR